MIYTKTYTPPLTEIWEIATESGFLINTNLLGAPGHAGSNLEELDEDEI